MIETMTGGELLCQKHIEEEVFGNCLREAEGHVRFVWLQESSYCTLEQKKTVAKFKFANDALKQTWIKLILLN